MFAPIPLAQKKRHRPSDGGNGAASGLVDLTSQAADRDIASHSTVPRTSTSAASWGVAQLSDSEGDIDFDEHSSSLHPSRHRRPTARTASPLGRRLAAAAAAAAATSAQPPPCKRPHLDEATSGKFASMGLGPTGRRPASPASPSGSSEHVRGTTRRGVGGVFGQAYLPRSISSDLTSFAEANSNPSPLAPPSSPTKTVARAQPASFDAYPLQSDRIAVAPPASPEQRHRVCAAAPPASPIAALSDKDASAWPPLTLETRDGDIEDLDMRIRRGPTSYEIEPDRIYVNSLDDTSSSDGDSNSISDADADADDDRSPESGRADLNVDGDGSGGAMGDFFVNKELMDKLEAHRRAVLTGTSDRDNEQSNKPGPKTSNGRARRNGRRSAGTAGGGGVLGLGSLLSARRRSAQSSQASSPGYATPITSEEANSALVLWRDPEEVLRAASASIAVPDNSLRSKTASHASQPVGSFGGANTPSSLRHESTFWPSASPGAAETSVLSPTPSLNGGATPFSFGDLSSPLAVQQSSLSSSYFGCPRQSQSFGGRAEREQEPIHLQQQSSLPQPYPFQHQSQHRHESVDCSDHFGMADEMELDE